jgi:catechol 2,3-dioxygenase-like lactoylglutathione lyase family enzyme
MSENETKLDGLNLVVRDMEATLAFYRRLGVAIPESSLWRTATGVHHVDLELPGGFGLDFDSADLAKGYNAGFEGAGSSGRTLIGFRVPTREAVDQRYHDLASAGYRGLQPPYDAFWGARYAIVEDPDGRQVGIMSPADPARRSAPPKV